MACLGGLTSWQYIAIHVWKDWLLLLNEIVTLHKAFIVLIEHNRLAMHSVWVLPKFISLMFLIEVNPVVQAYHFFVFLIDGRHEIFLTVQKGLFEPIYQLLLFIKLRLKLLVILL